MKLNRRFMKFLATTLSVVLLLTAFGVPTAEAGKISNLFTKIKDTVKNHPVKSALGAVAIGGSAILAAPFIAKAVGLAAGVGAVGKVGAVAAVAAAGSGIAAIGTTIWGGLVAAGGFVTGALGSLGAGIAGMFSGIAGFIGGIIGSPLFIPALVVIGAAVVGYILWKKYKRQKQDLGNGTELPNAIPTVGAPSTEVVVSREIGAPTGNEIPPSSNGNEIPVSGSQTPTPAASTEVVAQPAPVAASDELKTAHADYIKAYNKYIGLVTNIGGSENPDEEMRTNMRRQDVQSALTAYRDSYNKYIQMLRQSNSK